MKTRPLIKRLISIALVPLAGLSLSQHTIADELGEELYLSNCAVCHRSQGEGIAYVFPALQDNAYVSGDVEVLIVTILNGRGGMPSFRGELSDGELSAVINYVRTRFGNQASAIMPALVTKLRTAGSEKIISDHDVQ
jgi:mono/diheme cytochrome c family protein